MLKDIRTIIFLIAIAIGAAIALGASDNPVFGHFNESECVSDCGPLGEIGSEIGTGEGADAGKDLGGR